MIRVTDKTVEVKGDKISLMAQLTTLMRSLVEEGFKWEDIDLCVETAKMSPEEVAIQTLDMMLKNISKSLKD